MEQLGFRVVRQGIDALVPGGRGQRSPYRMASRGSIAGKRVFTHGRSAARTLRVAAVLAMLPIGSVSSAWTGVAPIGLVIQEEYRGALGLLEANPPRELLFKKEVYRNEVVATEADENTALQFLDGTRIQVGANSRLVLDKFVFDPETGTGEMIVSFGVGLFRFITGDMPKASYRLQTPTAVMAIRGTTLVIGVTPARRSIVGVVRGSTTLDSKHDGIGACDCQIDEGFAGELSEDGKLEIYAGPVRGIVDPAVMSDVPGLSAVALAAALGLSPAPAATTSPGGNLANGASDGPMGNANSNDASGGDPGGGDAGGGDPGGGDPGGGDPGGGDPGGGDPGGGDPGGGDPGGGDPGGGDPGGGSPQGNNGQGNGGGDGTPGGSAGNGQGQGDGDSGFGGGGSNPGGGGGKPGGNGGSGGNTGSNGKGK